MTATESIDISVTVCTYNRADMLRETLTSLITQHTGGDFTYEIVIVDNASTDHTPDVVQELAASSPVRVRYLKETRQGRVYARNRGIAEAEGEWLAFFDDDQVADYDWLAELITLAKKGARVVGGAVLLRLPEECKRDLPWACQRLLGASVGWPDVRPYTRQEGPGAGNLLIHRSVFEEIGVYDESYNLRGEDMDLYRRIREVNIDSWYTPRALAWHFTPHYRLTDKYLRDTSVNNGWSFARRDREELGRLALAMLLVARVCQMILIFLPRGLWGWFTRSDDHWLSAKFRFWMLQGYGKCALSMIVRDAPISHPVAASSNDSKSQQPVCVKGAGI